MKNHITDQKFQMQILQMTKINNLKKIFNFIILLFILNFTACFKVPEGSSENIPAPEPENFSSPISPPTPEPTPTPTPEPRPELTPPSAKTPEVGDDVFVLERFSVDHEHGSRGFKPGTKVRIRKIEADQFLVTDGEFEALKPASFFTSNPNKAESIANEINNKLANAEKERIARQKIDREKAAKIAVQAEEDQKKQARKNHRIQVAELKLTIAELNRRIDVAGDERVSKDYPRNGGSRYKYRDQRTVTLSKDASQIEMLINELNQLKKRLNRLELNPPAE